jgi:hypothetical protein
MRAIGSRREESSTRRSVESTSWRPGSTGRKAEGGRRRAEGGGRSTRGRGVRTGGVRRCVRYLAYPGGKARAHVASNRLPGSIRTSGIAEKPVGKPCRASPSSSMKNTPTGIDQDAGFRCVGREGLGAGCGVPDKAFPLPASRGGGAGRRGDTPEGPIYPRRSGRRQDAVMPMPNTCILPALTWRGSTMLVTTLPGGTGIFCAKM